ncbi:integrase core domain-containing protein [Corynebacterium mayonis]|uniref:integrase core domain-containing protein n=1 Tax=Corynebacterium mayonis TaxID=3062461 RepID=UPI003CC7CCD2
MPRNKTRGTSRSTCKPNPRTQTIGHSPVAHARHCVGLWSDRYNTYHPHSALGFIAPEEYKKQWLQAA